MPLTSSITPIILAGGTGTRLWPWSRPELPKQFLPLWGEQSLYAHTAALLSEVERVGAPVVVGAESHRLLLVDQLSSVGVFARQILTEPTGRNTAPAIVAAAMVCDPDELMWVIPADILISDPDQVSHNLSQTVDAAQHGNLVLFGIKPTSSQTSFGYFECSDTDESISPVITFVEKPDPKQAEQLVRSGTFLWNSGMLLATAETILAEATSHIPQVVTAVVASFASSFDATEISLGDSFEQAESISFDYGVLERSGRLVGAVWKGEWSDLGSWQAIHQHSPQDQAGNVISGDVVTKEMSNSLVRSHSRLVAVAGLEGVVVVETGDTVLVANQNQPELIKDLVSQLESQQRPEIKQQDVDIGVVPPG